MPNAMRFEMSAVSLIAHRNTRNSLNTTSDIEHGPRSSEVLSQAPGGNPGPSNHGQATAPDTGHSGVKMTWELSVSVLFGVGIDVAHQYPGIWDFCQHLEDTYHPQFLRFDGAIWGILGRERQESVEDFWEWCFSVARAWRSLRTGNNGADNPTIQAVLCQFLSGPYSRSRMENLNEIPKAVISGAIVQTLCWLSAAVKPLMYVPTPHEAAAPQAPRPPDTLSTIEAQDTTGPFTTTGSGDGTIAAQVMDTPDPASATITQTTYESHWSGLESSADERSQGHSTTPTASGIILEVEYGEKTVSVERRLEEELGDMFHALYVQAAHGRQNAEPVAWNAAKFAEDILHKSRITYAILKKYGAIELKWVDTINQHMHLDLRTRELSLFRFPSLCAVRANGATPSRDVSMTANITNWLIPYTAFPHPPYPAQDEDVVCQEIILSYRLLFSQCLQSRKLLEHALELEKEKLRAVDPYIIQCVANPSQDSIWGCLGLVSRRSNTVKGFNTNILPKQARDGHKVREWNTYSASMDFPVFGWRLKILQAIGGNHPPTGFGDYLTDRRYLATMYTAQVGFAVAALTISIGLVQIGIASRQLAEARE